MTVVCTDAWLLRWEKLFGRQLSCSVSHYPQRISLKDRVELHAAELLLIDSGMLRDVVEPLTLMR